MIVELTTIDLANKTMQFVVKHIADISIINSDGISKNLTFCMRRTRVYLFSILYIS